IAGLTANWLAGRQAKSLSAARAKKIADDPDLPQKDYQQAREAMLGKDFSTAPAGQACIPCMCNAKAARRAERLNLVSQGVNGCPDHADAAARLRRDMDQVEHARVAKAVYKKDPIVWGDNPQPPYDVVFRGSTLAPEDWQNNFAQNANNESSYYQKAAGIGNAIAKYGAADQVQLVGHS